MEPAPRMVVDLGSKDSKTIMNINWKRLATRIRALFTDIFGNVKKSIKAS